VLCANDDDDDYDDILVQIHLNDKLERFDVKEHTLTYMWLYAVVILKTEFHKWNAKLSVVSCVG